MKKILLSTLLFASLISTLKAQIYTPSGTIQGVSLNDNVGIGTNQSIAKLTIKAGFEAQPTPLKAISIWGPNSPLNSNSAQDLSWDFASAGSASIRSYRGSSWDTYLQFLTNSNIGGNAPQVRMHIDYAGNVGIGTTVPTSKLTVAGNIHSREVKVTVNAGADFVFAEDYALPSLDSVHQYIKENKHLPEIASASEMKKDGINLSEMNIKLLQKVEELTLYMIEMKKENEKQNEEIKILKTKVSSK